MRRTFVSVLVLVLAGSGVGACNGTTGDELVAFPAYAAGAKGAGDPFSVNGYTIQLTYAHMYVGAIYVNEAPAGSGGTFNTPACISQGIYCAQVPGGLDVDLLSTDRQQFLQPDGSPLLGSGSADLGLSWELYLTQGDVNAPDNSGFGVHNTADLIGTATRGSDGQVFSWAATVTINQSNRGEPAQEPGQPGLNPICKQRIIELGGINLQLFPGGSLLLTIDPRGWFKLPLDFSTLPLVATNQCQLDQNSMYGDAEYCIPDASNLSGGVPGSQQGVTLYTGIFTAGNAAFALTYSSP
jgi:hypothetical protein